MNNNNELGWSLTVKHGEEKYIIEKKLSSKFANDKVSFENDKIILLLDGVILNKKELMSKYEIQVWAECVLHMHWKDKEFFNEFRGSFNGYVFDKMEKTFIAFGDHVGGRPVFYCNAGDISVIASNFNHLVKVLKSFSKPVQINENAVKYMLSFGAMIDNSTYVINAYRLLGGEYLAVSMGDRDIKRRKYFEISNKCVCSMSEKEIIELLDTHFEKALRREFDKDQEYGYTSLVDISGGMDSRTVCFGAKKLGYTNIINICMSQMNAYERKIAEKNVKLLGNDYVFTALDNGNFIYDIDEIVKLNYGLAYVGSVSGALKNTKVLNMENIGIHHTGILGDVHDGSFVSEMFQKEPNMSENKYFISSANNFQFSEFDISQYANQEMYLFKTRGILFGLTSNLIRQNVTETCSPFSDIDFLNAFFSISLEDRVKSKILQKWVLDKYPDINKTVYGNTASKLGVNIYWRKCKSMFRRLWNDYFKKVLYCLRFPVDISPQNSMNPFEYWYNTIPEFEKFIMSYYEDNLSILEKYPAVCGYCKKSYSTDKVLDKLLAMTVISAIKQYFN